MLFLVFQGYQLKGVVAGIIALEQAADLGREPQVSMLQSAECIEEHLGTAPRRSCGRDVDHEVTRNLAEAPVDVCLDGELLFEEANPQARQGSFQRVEL